MPDPVTMIALIGGGLLAAHELGKSKSDKAKDPYPQTQPNVAANAQQMGYTPITQQQYEANGVGPGETAAVTDANGDVTTVVGTGDGNQVVQGPDGRITIRSSDDAGIEVDPIPAKTLPVPPNMRPGMGAAVHPTSIVASAAAPVENTTPSAAQIASADPFANRLGPGLAQTSAKRPITNSLFNSRMMAATKKGFIIPH